MNNKENKKFIEKEIIEALKIDAKVDWSCEDPNKEFKDLIVFVNKLFKEDYGSGWSGLVRTAETAEKTQTLRHIPVLLLSEVPGR